MGDAALALLPWCRLFIAKGLKARRPDERSQIDVVKYISMDSYLIEVTVDLDLPSNVVVDPCRVSGICD